MTLLNRNSTLVPIMFFVIASALVVWFSFDSFARFNSHQNQLAKQSANNAAAEISNHMASLRRGIGLFAKREAKLLQNAAQNPDDKQVFAALAKQLGLYFPDYYSFTVANGAGVPLLTHSNFLLTKSCRRDLSGFARSFKAPTLYVHSFDAPQTLHFDLMTRFEIEAKQSVPFFVSFRMAALARLLKSGSVAGHDLVLVETSTQTGVQTFFGIAQNDKSIKMVRLSLAKTLEKPTAKVDIQASNWQVMNIPQTAIFTSARDAMMYKALALIVIFAAVALAMRVMLRRQTAQLERTGKVISGIEKDRRRIAMDMHDQVLSDLTFLSRQCENMRSSVDDQDRMVSHLKASEQALESVSDSIRVIIEDLHPQTLEILGLEASLDTYFNKSFSRLPSPKINFKAQPFKDKNLSDDERLNLYRITLEIVHNIVRHAKATTCNIALAVKEQGLVLSIEDDGTDFRPPNKSTNQSRGLSNINTRSALIGSSIGWGKPVNFSKGTRFELVLPLASMGIGKK